MSNEEKKMPIDNFDEKPTYEQLVEQLKYINEKFERYTTFIRHNVGDLIALDNTTGDIGDMKDAVDIIRVLERNEVFLDKKLTDEADRQVKRIKPLSQALISIRRKRKEAGDVARKGNTVRITCYDIKDKLCSRTGTGMLNMNDLSYWVRDILQTQIKKDNNPVKITVDGDMYGDRNWEETLWITDDQDAIALRQFHVDL